MKPLKTDRMRWSRLLTPLLCVFLFLPSATCSGADTGTPLKPKPEHASQCVKIIRALEQYHYLEKNLDNAMSSMILDRYIKLLDPGKLLFTLEDMNQLKQSQFRLDDQLKRGNLNTGFEIFNLYMARSRERLTYISTLIADWENVFDFSKNDVIILDHDLRQWKPNKQALYALWKNDLKNHIISMILDDQEKTSIRQTLDKIYSSRLNRLLQTNSNDIFQIFINSVTASFDPHTQFFPPRASEDFDIHMSLSLEGIGAVLQNEYEYTKIVRLISKGPADKSNLLMPGDKIIGVGQGETGEIKDTIGQRIDDVVKLIRGPKNTVVRLKIIPAKKSNSTQTIQIKRDRVKLEEQSAQKSIITLDHHTGPLKIGVIEIPNFYIDFNAYHRGDKDYKSTTKDVKKLLAELKRENIDGLIVDLRDNGGGSLKEAKQLTGLFIKSGPMVQIKSKYRITRLYDDDPTMAYDGPLIVLMNRMSASASEIFAGAIKDYHRGVIVGTRSFGKGTVQELQPLGEGKLKLTSAKFYRVSGESTQNLGIVPDLNYPQLYNIKDTGESSLDGALPWDQTVKTFYKAYRSLYAMNKRLDADYQERSLKDPGLTYLKKKIELAAKINNQTTLSLNLDVRKSRKKTYEQLELDIENNYLRSRDKAPLEKLEQEDTEIKDFKEILMNQTHLVMADFIDLSHEFNFSW
ncbi:carboxy terminal-processing peptidase [Desulfobacula sp.]|uniref:carboxy terminal-processing peptidase n=1 Tax=Desulfobacula sp. TaxID=2593537 RepID=UPI002637E2FD|nr:carboxy terminal-processing peptidase [Desulfobacula sp.]